MVVVLVGQQWRRWPVLPLCSSLSLSCTVLVYHYSQPALPPATYYNFQFKSLKLENLVLLNFDNEAFYWPHSQLGEPHHTINSGVESPISKKIKKCSETVVESKKGIKTAGIRGNGIPAPLHSGPDRVQTWWAVQWSHTRLQPALRQPLVRPHRAQLDWDYCSMFQSPCTTQSVLSPVFLCPGLCYPAGTEASNPTDGMRLEDK